MDWSAAQLFRVLKLLSVMEKSALQKVQYGNTKLPMLNPTLRITRAARNCHGTVEDVINQNVLVKLGWKPVPEIAGSSCDSWEKVMEALCSKGISTHGNGDWPSSPVVFTRKKLFKMDEVFLEKIKKAKKWRSVLADLKCKMYQQLESGDASFTSSSKAWSFALDSLAECVVTNSLCLTKLDGIASFGPWFTAGHIETGGDDSITHVPIGRKFMLIAERGHASRVLEGRMTSIDALMQSMRQPPAPLFKDKLRFYFTSPDSPMVQPALCAHSVVTLGNEPAVAAGFEAKHESDVKRRSQVLIYYSFGMGRETQKYLTANVSDSVVLTNLISWRKNKTALFEQLECLQYDARPDVSWIKRKNLFVPKRRRKAMYWNRYRNKITRKNEKKEGKEVYYYNWKGSCALYSL